MSLLFDSDLRTFTTRGAAAIMDEDQTARTKNLRHCQEIVEQSLALLLKMSRTPFYRDPRSLTLVIVHSLYYTVQSRSNIRIFSRSYQLQPYNGNRLAIIFSATVFASFVEEA